MKAITNTRLVMPEGIIWDGTLLFDNDKIVAVGTADEIAIPAGTEIIDAQGKYTAPGLIDIHNHGGGDWLFAENPKYCCEYFIKHGVTTVLPTFYHNLDKETMLSAAAKIREISGQGVGRIMDGLYMEGPFMSLFGSFQNEMKWSDPIKEEDYADLIAGFGDMVRIWAIDPLRENICAFMEYAKEKKPSVIFAHGHSVANSDDIRKIAHYGVKVRTHMGDCGGCKGRAHCTPGASGDEYCMNEPDMYAELICDESAVHVVPDIMKLYIRTKGVEKICLISDCMPSCTNYKNNEARGVWYGSDLNYDDEGLLAGSRMTLENACRNLMTHTGYGLCHAIRMATLNPAKLLGIDYKVGSLAVGKKANLIIIDDAVHVQKVFLEGELMVDNT